MRVSDLKKALDGQTRDAEIFIDGADLKGNQIWLQPLLVRPSHGGIAIVANQSEHPIEL